MKVCVSSRDVEVRDMEVRGVVRDKLDVIIAGWKRYQPCLEDLFV